MKRGALLAFVLLFCVASLERAFAGPFQNLDFEAASLEPALPNFVPWDAFDPIDASAALPFWTGYEDSSVVTALWGLPESLDETSIALVTPNSVYGPIQGPTPIQGMYGVELYGISWAPQGYFHTASIAQTGDVPIGAKSLRFLMRSPSRSGGWVEAVPTVTMNGAQVTLVAVATNSGVVTMAGDVRMFAGEAAELKITSDGSGHSGGENLFELDDISFSSEAVPEPTVLGFCILLCAALLRRGDPR